MEGKSHAMIHAMRTMSRSMTLTARQTKMKSTCSLTNSYPGPPTIAKSSKPQLLIAEWRVLVSTTKILDESYMKCNNFVCCDGARHSAGVWHITVPSSSLLLARAKPEAVMPQDLWPLLLQLTKHPPIACCSLCLEGWTSRPDSWTPGYSAFYIRLTKSQRNFHQDRFRTQRGSTGFHSLFLGREKAL